MTSSINAAMLQLVRRAEGNEVGDLVDTFVSAGTLIELLQSADHQIVYGRRGTGKTHLLQFLTEKVSERGDVAVYVDLRTVGSNGGIYADPNIPLTERGTRLLVDVLSHLYNTLASLLITASYGDGFDYTDALNKLDLFEASITDVRITGDEEQSVRLESVDSDAGQVSLAAGSNGIKAQFGGSSGAQSTSEVNASVRGPRRYNVHFGAVSSAIRMMVEALPGRLWLILDEWSDVPLDLQPLLADLLRRCVMPVRDVSVKVGAIEQRSNFSAPDGVGGYIGFELGADIFADLELDEFMVFGNDEERAKAFFAELLFKHVSRFLNDDGRASIADADEFVRKAFTQRNAFAEFVRAVEGVPRDAINIAILAAKVAADDPISVPHVRQAARQWYLRDKEKSVQANPQTIELLHWVIDEVIGTRRARAFLLEQGHSAKHDLVASLYDSRVLHVIKRGVSANDRPGVRFDVFTLDFGCYVQLISTTAAPEGLFEIEDEESGVEFVEVPKDDYRSIRRAVLDLEAFDRRKEVPPRRR
ncbi:hypothetical protein [Microbacterium sp.]|uniref:ORC-CDC6 family AAA ATPase n=1 Tax=Microbacterium sp. TaxID=51671 RepID=UPI0039E5F7EE